MTKQGGCRGRCVQADRRGSRWRISVQGLQSLEATNPRHLSGRSPLQFVLDFRPAIDALHASLVSPRPESVRRWQNSRVRPAMHAPRHDLIEVRRFFSTPLARSYAVVTSRSIVSSVACVRALFRRPGLLQGENLFAMLSLQSVEPWAFGCRRNVVLARSKTNALAHIRGTRQRTRGHAISRTQRRETSAKSRLVAATGNLLHYRDVLSAVAQDP